MEPRRPPDKPPDPGGSKAAPVPGLLRLKVDAKPFVPPQAAAQPSSAVPASAAAPTKPTQSRNDDRKRKSKPKPAATGGTQAKASVERPAKPAGGQRGGSGGGGRRNNNNGGGRPSQPASVPRADAAAASASAAEPPKGGGRKPAAQPRRDVQSAMMSEQSKELQRKLDAGRYECMICMSVVGKKAKIWSCGSCHVVLHLPCVLTWAHKSGEDGSWRCPHCQTVMLEDPRHVCYCGKTVRPDADPFLVVGSCGEVCERLRVGTDCPHKCILTCHPGPCPPCSLMGPPRTCHCGKRSYTLKCSEVEPEGSSCGAPCGRSLSCGAHTCQRACHAGPCDACPVLESQQCYCGKARAERPCGSGLRDVGASSAGEYSCAAACGKMLACGVHSCDRPCHAGACPECPTAPSRVTRCPCGATALPQLRQRCTDPIPCCGNVCGRAHPVCGHPCSQRCHSGPCAPCELGRVALCRCGSAKREVKCAQLTEEDSGAIRSGLLMGEVPRLQSSLCHQRCSALKSCGRHRCEIACCPSFKDAGDAAGRHVCRLQCGKKLNCGNPLHKCLETCHKGKCAPCLQASFEEWVCPCGQTRVFPPIKCGQQMPVCMYPCNRGPRACGHVDITSHPCHPNSEPCPPCVQLVDARCACGTEARSNVRCHLAPTVSCGKPCNVALPCGQHKCVALCHRHVEQPQLARGCGQPCGLPLDCGHPCASPCHPTSPNCPFVMCQRKATITCPCGRQVQQVPCKRVHGVADSAPPLPVLECDDACAKEQRKRLLAEVFGKQHTQWQERQQALGLARTHPAFLRRVEAQLATLTTRNADFDFAAHAATGSITPNVVFPSATSPQRKLVHFVADLFGLAHESFGDEGHRSVWVTLTPQARVPERLLSAVLDEQQVALEAKGFRASDCGVLLSQMSTGVRTPHIEKMMQDWKGQWALHWLDDHSALVIFDEPGAARVAVNTLRGPFVATIFHEENYAESVRKPISNAVARPGAAVAAAPAMAAVAPVPAVVAPAAAAALPAPVRAMPTVQAAPAIATSNTFAALQAQPSAAIAAPAAVASVAAATPAVAAEPESPVVESWELRVEPEGEAQ